MAQRVFVEDQVIDSCEILEETAVIEKNWRIASGINFIECFFQEKHIEEIKDLDEIKEIKGYKTAEIQEISN